MRRQEEKLHAAKAAEPRRNKRAQPAKTRKKPRISEATAVMVPESAFLPEAALPDSAEPPLEPEQPARPKPATASADMPAMPMKLRRLM